MRQFFRPRFPQGVFNNFSVLPGQSAGQLQIGKAAVGHQFPYTDGGHRPALRQQGHMPGKVFALIAGAALSIHKNLPAAGLGQAAQKADQRGLAAAVWPHHGVQPAGAKAEADIFQHRLSIIMTTE